MLWTNAFAARVSQNVSTITAKIMVLLYEYHHKYFCCTIKPISTKTYEKSIKNKFECFVTTQQKCMCKLEYPALKS